MSTVLPDLYKISENAAISSIDQAILKEFVFRLGAPMASSANLAHSQSIRGSATARTMSHIGCTSAEPRADYPLSAKDASFPPRPLPIGEPRQRPWTSGRQTPSDSSSSSCRNHDCRQSPRRHPSTLSLPLASATSPGTENSANHANLALRSAIDTPFSARLMHS